MVAALARENKPMMRLQSSVAEAIEATDKVEEIPDEISKAWIVAEPRCAERCSSELVCQDHAVL